MKNAKLYIALLLFTFGFISCNKFLDREPLGQVGQEGYFNSETNANAAVVGMYRTMLSSYSYGQSIVIVPEFSANHVSHASSFPEYESFSLHGTPTTGLNEGNQWIKNIWTATYATINAANNVIDEVPQMADNLISDENRNIFVGEAKFIRALHYFFLVRAFGRVPLKLTATTEDEDLDTPQAEPEATYTQIVKDLTEAIELLPEANPYTGDAAKGRASHLASKALLAKVYLYLADYGQATTLAEEIIASQQFSLVNNFSSIWSTQNTTESIFELQFEEQATNSLALTTNGGSMLFHAKGSIPYNIYEDDDQRRDFTVKTEENEDGTLSYFIGKYPNFSPATQNLPIIRLAEIYLIHAEAKARIDNSVSAASYASLKAVQDRAGNTKPIGTYPSLEAYITAIQEEKERELMFEGETWFDFCRTGLALEKYASLTDPNYYVYPIPGEQIPLSPGKNLTQNPGY